MLRINSKMDVLRQLRYLLSRGRLTRFDSEINLTKFTSKFIPARKIPGFTRGTFQGIRRKNYTKCSRLTSVPDPPKIRWLVSL